MTLGSVWGLWSLGHPGASWSFLGSGPSQLPGECRGRWAEAQVGWQVEAREGTGNGRKGLQVWGGGSGLSAGGWGGVT